MRIKKLSQFKISDQGRLITISICMFKRKIIYLSRCENEKSVRQVDSNTFGKFENVYNGEHWLDYNEFTNSDKRGNYVRVEKGYDSHRINVIDKPRLLNPFTWF